MCTKKNHAFALSKGFGCQCSAIQFDIYFWVLKQVGLVRPEPKFGQLGNETPRLGYGRSCQLKIKAGLRHI